MCVCLVQLMTSARKGDMEGRHGFLVVSKGRFQQNKCQQWAQQTSLRSQRKNSMQLSWHWARALQLAKSIQSSEGWTRPIWRFVQQVVWPTSYRNIFVGCKPPVRLWASGLAWRTNIADGGIAFSGASRERSLQIPDVQSFDLFKNIPAARTCGVSSDKEALERTNRLGHRFWGGSFQILKIEGGSHPLLYIPCFWWLLI